METIESEQKKYRGTIIVDTNFLLHSSSAFPDEYRADTLTPRNYLDFLKFLAKNNYHIIIPEMVALEAGAVTHDGFDISKVLVQNKFPKKNELNLFLKETAKGELNNIEIVTKTGPELIDKFCKDIETAVETYEINIKSKRKKTKNQEGIKNPQGFASANLSYDLADIYANRGADYGDKAIISMLEKREKNKEPNVFILSDDVDLIKKINSNFSNDTPVTLRSFFYTIAANNLLPACGVIDNKWDDTILALENTRVKLCKTLMPKNNYKEIDLENHTNYLHKFQYYRNNPFYLSLQNLAYELENRKKEKNIREESFDESIQIEQPILASERINKFHEKYGRNRNSIAARQ